MEPWIAPIRDNLGFLMGSKRTRPRKNQDGRGERPQRDDGSYLSVMQERGVIEIEAITFIRGRSIPNAFIVIDEAQNLSMHELKTIVTRVGDGTKIVLTGDIEQIDNVHVEPVEYGDVGDEHLGLDERHRRLICDLPYLHPGSTGSLDSLRGSIGLFSDFLSDCPWNIHLPSFVT